MAHGLRMVVATAALITCGWTNARAEQWVTQLSCDSVTIQGVSYSRIQFKVHNLWDTPYPVIQAIPIASPSSGDTCRVLSAVGPPQWSVFVDPSGLWVYWEGQGEALWPGQVLEGFQLIVPREHPCCFEMWFANAFDSAMETDCFDCDIPVPILRRTWGALKSLYR